jgi:hypothetical protein
MVNVQFLKDRDSFVNAYTFIRDKHKRVSQCNDEKEANNGLEICIGY